jgi:hypothetical protein
MAHCGNGGIDLDPPCAAAGIDPLNSSSSNSSNSSSTGAPPPPPPPPSPSPVTATAASTGDAAALVLGSWLTAHALDGTGSSNDDRAADRFRAIAALGSLLAAGAADGAAVTSALLDQALREGEDPVLRVAALWALGQAGPSSALLDAVATGLLPPPPLGEGEGEERQHGAKEQEEELGQQEDPIAAFQRLFLEHLQLAAGAHPQPQPQPQPQHPPHTQPPPQPHHNPRGLLLPPRTSGASASDRGAGALQAAAVRALRALAPPDGLGDRHVVTLIAVLHSGRSEAVARLAAKALLDLPPARLLPHVELLARAGRVRKGAWCTREGAQEEQAAAWLRMMMFGGAGGDHGDGGGNSGRWQPNTVVFDALYARLPSELLRPLARALLAAATATTTSDVSGCSPPPSPLSLAPFLAVPALRAQLTLEEVAGIVARVERAAGLVPTTTAAAAADAEEEEEEAGEVGEEIEAAAVDTIRLVLLHSTEVRS